MGCARCGRRDFVLLGNRAAGLHGDDEIITYDREQERGGAAWCVGL